MKARRKKISEILLVSSLAQSKLNIHILQGLRHALQKHPDITSVECWPPQDVPQRADLGRFDLLIYVGSVISDAVPHHLISMSARKVGLHSVCWATDDPYEFDFRYRAALYDTYISNDSNASDSYLERGNVYSLPLAAPLTDKREIVPLAKRAKGMFFCGYPYANRKLLIDNILEHPDISRSDIIVSGQDWGDRRLNVMKAPKSHDKLIDTYAGSEFVLNIGRTFNLANEQYNLVAQTPGPRTFECALAGTPQLYFGNVTEIENFFQPDEEILVCETVGEIASKIKELRTDQDRWYAIAKNAQIRTSRDHLYDNRVSDLIQIVSQCSTFNPLKKHQSNSNRSGEKTKTGRVAQ